jgi:hypothetical protein
MMLVMVCFVALIIFAQQDPKNLPPKNQPDVPNIKIETQKPPPNNNNNSNNNGVKKPA